jgi:GNAT superfamily N-acetyltransferase
MSKSPDRGALAGGRQRTGGLRAGWRGSRCRIPGHGTGRDVPGQARQPVPELHSGHHAIRAHDDGQRRVGHQGPHARGRCVASETDVDPVGVLPGARSCGGTGPGCAADPHQDQAVPTAEIGQSGAGAPRGQHGGASGQDRVQPPDGLVRSASDRALADISFLIEDEFQGRGLGTVLMGALAIAARRNGICRFCADVLAENAPMRAILAHAGIKWQPAQAGVVHGYAAVPDPGTSGIAPGTAAALAAVVDEMNIRL